MPTIFSAATIAQAQAADDQLEALARASSLKLQKLQIDGVEIFCDVNKNIVRPYLPEPLRRRAFDVVHGLSHPGGRTTAAALASKFVWPGVRKQGRLWVQQCEQCQASKVHRHNREAFGRFTEPDNRFEHIHVDLIKLPLFNGFQYCLTIIDRFSRWPIAVPLQNIQANTVARAIMDHWVSFFGTPLCITSDKGAQFESQIFTELAKLLGTRLQHTTSYHPQSNGMVERFHRTLKAALRCCAQPWTDCLPMVMLGLRSALKEDLQASPAEMVFGTSLRLPGDFFTTNSIVADHSSFARGLKQLFKSIKPVQASRHASYHPFRFKDLQSCTHVFKRVDSIRKPLERPYSGPYRVIRRTDHRTFILDINGDEKEVTVDQLKPAYLEMDAQTPTASAQSAQLQQGPELIAPASPSFSPPTHLIAPAHNSTLVTGGGVNVETPVVTTDRRSRRKQELIPRDWDVSE